ncbi:uncharacterized protein LOC144069375 isoform X2 [Stigmatopora argus]
MMMMMMMMMVMRRRGRCQTLFLHFKQDKARSSSIPRLVAHVDRHAWSRLRHFLRHYLLLSSDSPSLDSSAELSIVATDELFCITKLSLTLTRAPVEQVNKYLGDLVNLLQDLVVTLVDVTDHSFMFSCCLCQEDFPSLKERYGLQAQFESFPEALMEVFGECGCAQSSSESRYDLVLSSDSPSLDGSAELSIVETDELFCITKLSLTLTRATVEQVNKYVGDLVTLLQEGEAQPLRGNPEAGAEVQAWRPPASHLAAALVVSLVGWLSIRMANSTSASRDPGSSRIASSSRISTFSRRGGRAESLKALSAAKMRNSTESFATLRTPCGNIGVTRGAAGVSCALGE